MYGKNLIKNICISVNLHKLIFSRLYLPIGFSILLTTKSVPI